MRIAEAATEASDWDLMQRAGEGAAQWVWRVAAERAVTVLCGPGNNGGDGYVIAQWLYRRGIDVQAIAPLEPSTDAAREARARYDGPVTPALGTRRAPLLVDAVFGYGLTRPVTDEFAKILEEASANHSFCIAIDVPSGVASDSGEWLGAARSYDLTLSLGAWKRAHWLMPAREFMGERHLIEIGLASEGYQARVSARPQISPPPVDSHKYRRGLLTIVAGLMAGAARLAGEAALRAGAGYVKIASERPVSAAPAELVIAGRDALDDPRIAALLIGPGLGRDGSASANLAAVLDRAVPSVIDADALHLLDWDALEGVATARLLLTPHDGELETLCATFGVMASSRLERATGLRDATGANILAKGPDTLLAPAGGGVVFFPQASSWLSTAGSGDVLAGVAASRLAHHGDAARAGEEAVWLHREAARIAGPAFSAGKLARMVAPAMARFL